MLATQPKTFDKRDRAIKAAIAAIGPKALLGLDYEISKTDDKRFTWTKLAPVYQPKVKDRVHNIHDQVDGVLRPDIRGTVLVVGPTVSEVKWDKPAPWGQLQNCLNRHLQPVDSGIPDFLKVENRKPLAPEKKAALDKRMEEAKVKPIAEAQRDFTLPKNIEPAGLEILAASGLGKKAAVKSNGKAETPAKSKHNGPSKEFSPEHTITVLSKSNPKRAGSNAYKVFELYKPNMTVAQFLAKVPDGLKHLRWDTKHSFIKIGSGK